MYEGTLCVCCMSTEDLVQLFGSESEGDGVEHYAKILAVCLRIPISETEGHDSICTQCVSRLKDFTNFKVMTLKSISILSSVDLTELLTEEELQVLGLNKSEQNNKLESNSGVEGSESTTGRVKQVAKIKTNKEKIKEIQAKLTNYDTEVLDVEDSDNSDKVPAAGEAGAVLRRAGRGRGRPRVRSPDGLPYHLDKRELICRECGEAFPNHITLKIHYNTHFGRHACAECDKRFVSRGSLAKHVLAHRPGPFRCDVCQMEFGKINTLLSHKRYKHAARAAYGCGACALRFRTLHARLAHRAAAHGPAPRRHRCPHCAALFAHSGERAKHVSTHHEVRFAECAECGARLRRGSLRGHLRRHRETRAGPAPKAAAERRFACRLCGKAFSQKHTLLYHIGSHVRRGLYAGPRAALVADRARRPHRAGLLSDIGSDHSEKRSDSSLSDHTQRLLDAGARDDDIHYMDYRASSGDDDPPGAPGSDGLDGRGKSSSDAPEICIDFGFNIPSDFDE